MPLTPTQRAKLQMAEQITEDLVRSVPSGSRTFTKLHAALDNLRAAYILMNEGEQASVGHSDDPKTQNER